MGYAGGISRARWPVADERYLAEKTIVIPVQVNGKVRAEISIARDASQEEVEALARQQENVVKHVAGAQVKKVVYVPSKLINFVW